MMFLGSVSWAQNDSIDVLNYDLTIDLDHNLSRTIEGRAVVSMRLLSPCREISLDFQSGTIDSVCVNGVNTPFTFVESKITFPAVGLADTVTVEVAYRTGGYVEGYGFGGFHIGSSIHYNLGIAFEMWPPSMGRTWFPCRDNFYDKASYRLAITCAEGWRAICSGSRLDEQVNPDGSTTSTWWLAEPTPTYLFSVAVAPFHTIERTVHSLYGDYPLTLGFTSHDSASVARAYEIVDSAVPMYERCLGPYRWNRIGYVATPKGSMEHVNNIALVSVCMGSMSQRCQGTICHELGHAWFGNLVTCTYPSDMWINEGGASFTTELAFEAAYGRDSSDRYYNTQLESVLRLAHITDEGFYALHGVAPSITYGSTTYDKGHMMWHSLRGYLGDSLFYASMRTFFDRAAFKNLDAWQVRDSLSLYSGVDLTKFFDFQVFEAGFVDYVLDSLRTEGMVATVGLHQQSYGTTASMQGNRVPVTFFDDHRNQAKRWLEFDGQGAVASFTLPFEARYAIVDYDREISDAVTDGEVTLAPKSGLMLGDAHAYVYNNATSDSVYVHVAHHWSSPQGDMPEGVITTTARFWSVNTNGGALGRFAFGHGESASVPYLDMDFNPAESDATLGLLYRPDASKAWQLVSTKRRGALTDGLMQVENLVSGDYTVALVDTSLLGIVAPQASRNFITPNPSRGRLTLDCPAPGRSLRLYSLSGALVADMPASKAAIRVNNLPAGTYVARLVEANGRLVATQRIIIVK